MSLEEVAEERIRGYGYKGGLDATLFDFWERSRAKPPVFAEHSLRVALMAEAVAGAFSLDPRGAFAAGFLHDIGKLHYPGQLLDGENIEDQEVLGAISWHSIIGYQELKDKHLLCAFVAGTHHEQRSFARYGVLQSNVASVPLISQRRMAQYLAAIVGICDSLDASLFRRSISAGFEEGPCQGIKAQYGRNSSFAELVVQISQEVLRQNGFLLCCGQSRV
ncbi:MAG TPA: HD domain-containing protein [Candidatus Moranbacteria bacterium]|nr:HD domain-containing protein [Candidatus Moranbacteria bacterium]